MLVEQRVKVGRQDGMGQEWTGRWSTGQAQAGTAEPWAGGTRSSLTRELDRRGRSGRMLQERFAVLLAALVTGENGIHTELQQRLVA